MSYVPIENIEKKADVKKTADDKIVNKFIKDVNFLDEMLTESSKTYLMFRNKYDKYKELNSYSEELKTIMRNIVPLIQDLRKLSNKMESI